MSFFIIIWKKIVYKPLFGAEGAKTAGRKFNFSWSESLTGRSANCLWDAAQYAKLPLVINYRFDFQRICLFFPISDVFHKYIFEIFWNMIEYLGLKLNSENSGIGIEFENFWDTDWDSFFRRPLPLTLPRTVSYLTQEQAHGLPVTYLIF